MTGTAMPAPGAGDAEAPAWFRESVERTFSVGDRVRIRLSAECEHHWVPLAQRASMRVDGQTGVVVETGSEQYEGHPIIVYLDDPFAHPDAYWTVTQCPAAPIELEPLTAPAAADGQEGPP